MIEANDFLAFAQTMERNNETDDRVCIGRAYYAAVHFASKAAQTNGYQHDPHEAGSMHSNLIFYFERCATEDSLLVADLLKKLKRSRQQADYQLEYNIFSSAAKTALKQAQTVFDVLQA